MKKDKTITVFVMVENICTHIVKSLDLVLRVVFKYWNVPSSIEREKQKKWLKEMIKHFCLKHSGIWCDRKTLSRYVWETKETIWDYSERKGSETGEIFLLVWWWKAGGGKWGFNHMITEM